MKSPSLLQLRLAFLLLLAIIIAWLGWQAIAPLGRQQYTLTPCAESFVVSKISPPDRVGQPQTQDNDCFQRITGEPAYFNILTQRTFSWAHVTVTYRAHQVPTLSLGVLADANNNYHLEPLAQHTLDTLNWPRISEGPFTLLQKNETYSSINAFIADPPEQGVYTYHASLPFTRQVTSRFTATQPAFQPLRGSYRFYAAHTNDGPLVFDFFFTDLNASDDPDPVTVAVYYNETPVATRTLPDSRGNEGSSESHDTKSLPIVLDNAPTGAYTVQVTASDDIITRDLQTYATALSFINRVHLAHTPNPEPLTLATTVQELAFSTPNPQSTQTITVNEESVEVAEPFRQYTHHTTRATSSVALQTNGIIIAGNGVFAFAADNLFQASYPVFDRTTDLKQVEYIFTSYQPSAPETGWQTRSATFDLKNALRYNNRYGFLLSIPGLRADDEDDDWVEIKSITIELQGTTLWEKLQTLWKKDS